MNSIYDYCKVAWEITLFSSSLFGYFYYKDKENYCSKNILFLNKTISFSPENLSNALNNINEK